MSKIGKELFQPYFLMGQERMKKNEIITGNVKWFLYGISG